MSLPVSNYGIAMTICRLTLTSMGVAGNIMSFIIFSRKTFRNNSISTYCRALAVLDCLILIQLIADVYSFINLTYFYNINDASCKLFYYFSILVDDLNELNQSKLRRDLILRNFSFFNIFFLFFFKRFKNKKKHRFIYTKLEWINWLKS